ncbi:MAG: hypothetical protein IKT42_05720 [Clostridia bacterium]|nr:hypothetical protein [Clostridia bacterium]
MYFSKVPVNLYKKVFIILLCVFFSSFVLEFLTALLGHPINNIYIENINLEEPSIKNYIIMSVVTAFTFGGIANVFCTIRIVKEKLKIDHWPAFAVVVMTILFILEMLVGIILLLPNIIIFGLKSRPKNRIFEVDFR